MNFSLRCSPPEPEEINTSNSIIAVPAEMLKEIISTSSSAGRSLIKYGGGFSDDDRKVEMIEEEIYTSDEFRMYAYKIKRCPRTRSHDWTECPYAHRGEKAQRRDPRKYRYSAIVCAAFRDTAGTCPKGDACEHAHGVFEYWLHPAKYRTRACNAGNYCQRKVCFFAHSPDQLRPDTKYHNHNNKQQYYCRSTTTTTAACMPVPAVGAAAAHHQAADHHIDDEYYDQYAGREYCDPKINEGNYNIKLAADHREVSTDQKEDQEKELFGIMSSGGEINNYMNSSDYALMKKLRGLSLICRPDDDHIDIDNNNNNNRRSRSSTHQDIDIINDDEPEVVNNINCVIKGGSSSKNYKKSINYVNGGGGYAAAAAGQYCQMSMRTTSAGLGTLEALSGDEELERLGWISDLLRD